MTRVQCHGGRDLNDQETRGGPEAPIESAVRGPFGFLALKDHVLATKDIRGLLSVRKQLASEEIREVKVTWVDSSPDPFASSI